MNKNNIKITCFFKKSQWTDREKARNICLLKTIFLDKSLKTDLKVN